MPDLYDSDTSVNSDNEVDNEPTEPDPSDEENDEKEPASDESEVNEPVSDETELKASVESEVNEPVSDETEDPEEVPEDPSEASDDESDASLDMEEMPPVDVDVIGNEDEFAELYKETNLNLFVTQLKPFLDETVRVMLGCKSKYVEIDVSTDMFGWAKQIKYPTEQFKTFVPTIPIQFVNMLATNAAQRVNDMETIYDGLKSSDIPLDTFTFLRQRKTDQTIESISPTINNVEFESSTPMLDLALQNPGYLSIIGDPNSKLKGAFNFLSTALVKPSKKQKIIRGKKEAIKTFNLRDIVYILSAAGAKKIVFYNVSNSFTVEDNEVEELSVQADLGEPDEVSLDMSALEPKEEEEEEEEDAGDAGEAGEEAVGEEAGEDAGEDAGEAGEAGEEAGEEAAGEEASDAGEEASEAGEEAGEEASDAGEESGEEASDAGEEASEAASAIGEVSNAGQGVVDASVANEAVGEANDAAEAVVPVNSEESEISSVGTPGSESSIVGGSMFDGKLGGKYTRRARERRKTSRKLSLIHKRHR